MSEPFTLTPLAPMLAVPAAPFDGAEYLFEVKWDGIRTLAGATTAGWRLWGRDRADYQPRYPELAGLGRLPAGTVLDGEVVLLQDGVPDLDALLVRHRRARPGRWGRDVPVRYVVFDALYDRGRCLFGWPLEARRAVARDRVGDLADARVAFAEGVVGSGRAFFAAAVARGHEGVVAKHRASRYVPGRRSAAWKKVKPAGCLPCVVVGYVPGPGGVRALYVAALHAGGLRYVGRLPVGWGGALRARLARLLGGRVRAQPAVPCPAPGVWVEPDVYCTVRHLGWTPRGRLRGARLRGLLSDPGGAAASAPV